MPTAVNGARRGTHDDVVLTGLSARLPECDNIDEFAQKLFDGVDLVTADDRRWTPGLHGLPERSGKLKDLKHFDASFFGVSGKQAHVMDPQLRMLLELTHEAVVDAGLSPCELRGSRTGVFVGVSNSETEEMWTVDPDQISGYALTGCCRAMFPNRISYTFDLKGPSYAVDTACSSSMFALAQALAAMRAGHCDAALVAGTNLCLKPANSLNFHRLSMLSPEGRCAAFDAAGRGYVRSEAAVVVLLQRRGDARRVYATVRNIRTNTDGAKEQGITFPNGDMQRRLARETFEEARLDPRDVAYVEAHGTGTKVGDPQEVNAIAELFCGAERAAPLLLGSVKSNMGHSEPASGLCSIAKVVVAMERGVIPANLHYSTPNPDVPALSDGRILVVARNTPWAGGLVAVNSFGFGGANAHAILESEPAPRPPPAAYPAPRLLLASGRTESAVRRLLRRGADHPRDRELHALLDAVHAHNIPGHERRGYRLVVDVDPPSEEVAEFPSSERRPVWFAFSGMGSQWAGMARTLMSLPVFASSVSRSAAALRPHGVDLVRVLTEAAADEFDDVINCFVSIAAVQVALVDVLRAVGVRPDGIVGHSVGEVGCAYADETLTGEQAVLCAYWRGRSILDAGLEVGAMAAVGLTWEEAAERCPEGVSPACHNAVDSVTVSGAARGVAALVARLEADGVFARRVNSAGVAFHSEYIAPAAPALRRSLEKVIPHPKPRSRRWISTSLPEDEWDSELARLSDAAYHVNNLLSPVLFYAAMRHIPARAIVVEVAPHALLGAVLRRALPHAAHVPLVRRDAPDAATHLLQAVGKLYCHGLQPAPAALYGSAAAVSWPVSRGTPALAGAVEWDHAQEWAVAQFGAARGAETVIEFSLERAGDAFLEGHNIDGRVLFPATGYLTLVWRTMAKLHNRNPEETAVMMEDVQFRRATIITREAPVTFGVSVLDGGGQFEVREGGAVAVTGRVRIIGDTDRERLPPAPETPHRPAEPGLLAADVYKELRLRGYMYGGAFRGIRSSDARGTRGELAWEDNWISFMDTMLQFAIIGSDTRELYLPTRLQRALIDPAAHSAALGAPPAGGARALPVRMERDVDAISSGGVELRGLKTSLAPRRASPQAAPKLERYAFVPYRDEGARAGDPARARRDALVVSLQIVLENAGALKLRAVEEALGRAPDALLLPAACALLQAEPQVRVEAALYVTGGAPLASYGASASLTAVGAAVSAGEAPAGGAQVVLAAGALGRHSGALPRLSAACAANGMLLLEETLGALDEPAAAPLIERAGLVVVSRQSSVTNEYVLLRHTPPPPPPPADTVLLDVDDDRDFGWVPALRDAMQRAADRDDMRVYVIARNEDSGVLGLGTCLRGEAGGRALRVFMMPGRREPWSSFARQVELDLAVNVLRGDRWGSYRHLPLDEDPDKQLQVEHAYVNTLTRGDLSSLRWIESPLRTTGAPPADQEMCRVYYAPLNFRDVMLATGRLPPDALPGALAGQECILGLEFSGRAADGRRVMGMVAARGLATAVIADRGFMWPVPDEWTLEQAATVPVAYATAYYALTVRGGMRRGETVLVHAGTGGVGQAAIEIALAAGCRVLTTAGTTDKRAFLLERFPTLAAEDVGDSRSTSFEQLVRRRTGGRGVDLVLNSLAEDKLLASVRCLALGGRFLEIGKLDLSNDTALGMSVFLKNTTFHGILLDALFDAGADSPHKAAVVRCVSEGIASGAVRPLPATVYDAHQLEPAFRFMSAGRHVGKVLLRVRAEEPPPSPPSPPRLVPALPRVYMHPDRSYVLVGGLGGFGLELAQWLTVRGARHLVLNSRSGVRTGYQAWCVRRWRETGVTVTISTTDVTTVQGARQLLIESGAQSAVGGVFHLAAVLKDALLENLEPEHFKAVAKPKVDGVRALDAASRSLCPQLEHFVVFSSVSCGRGNAGQTNYGLANSVMERVVERRQADGLPGLAVQWGAIGEVGLVAEAMGGDVVEVGGTVPQVVSSCMHALGALMAQPHAVGASMVLADKGRARDKGQTDLVHAVANILGIKDPSKASDTASLAELGMDSLMGAEIKQTLERGYDVALAVHDIRALSFGRLRELQGGGAPADAAPASTPAPADEEALAQWSGGELVPEHAVVRLPSAASGAPGSRPAFMVHPIEGVVDVLRGVASGVRGRVYGLQCAADVPLDDMRALAARYVREMRTLQPRAPYVLVGYSFGAGVAVEMALQLQAAGCDARLVLVDGSPAYLATHTTRGKAKRATRSAAADEADALAYFVQLFADVDPPRLAAELERLDGWEARVRRAVSPLIAGGAMDEAALCAAALSFYRKLVIADTYRPADKLAQPVRLYTARDNYVTLDEHYGLRDVCSGELSARQLPGTHRTILQGESARAIADHVSSLLVD